MRSITIFCIAACVFLLSGCEREEQHIIARVGNYRLSEEQIKSSADPAAYVNSWLESRLLALEAESEKLDYTLEFIEELERLKVKLLEYKLLDYYAAKLDSPSQAEIERYYQDNESDFKRVYPEAEIIFFSGLDELVLKKAARDLRLERDVNVLIQKYPGLQFGKDRVENPLSLPQPFNGYFAKPEGTVIGPVEVGGRQYVYKISARFEPGSLKPVWEVKYIIMGRILEDRRYEIRERLLKELREKYNPEIDVQRLNASGIIIGDFE